jgi:hypothetical protein
MKTNQLLALLIKHKKHLKTLGVKDVGLFGSFVKGKSTPQSDIDILVDFYPQKKTFDNYMEVKFFLEDLLGREVDLVIKEAIKPGLKKYILKEVKYTRNIRDFQSSKC